MSGMANEREGEGAPGLSSAVPVACSARTVVPRAMRACIRDMVVCRCGCVAVAQCIDGITIKYSSSTSYPLRRGDRDTTHKCHITYPGRA